MLEDLLQTFWVIVGACSGLMIGLTHEGADLVASLGSVKGWKQIYTGSAPRKAKKLDNGDYRLKPQPASGVVTDTITVLTAFPNKLGNAAIGVSLHTGITCATDTGLSFHIWCRATGDQTVFRNQTS